MLRLPLLLVRQQDDLALAFAAPLARRRPPGCAPPVLDGHEPTAV